MNILSKILLCLMIVPSPVFSMQLFGLVMGKHNHNQTELKKHNHNQIESGLYQFHNCIKSPEEAHDYISNVGTVNKFLHKKIQKEPATVRTIIRILSNDYNKETIAKRINTKPSQVYLAVNTELHTKGWHGKKELQKLYTDGADFDFISTKPFWSSVLIRSLIDKEKIITYLLNHGANPNLEVNGVSPLEAALLTGSPEKIQLLLDHGARIKNSMLSELVHHTLSNPLAKDTHDAIKIIHLLCKYKANKSEALILAQTFQKIAVIAMDILNKKIVDDLSSISQEQTVTIETNNLNQLVKQAFSGSTDEQSRQNGKIIDLMCTDDSINIAAHYRATKFQETAVDIIKALEKK